MIASILGCFHASARRVGFKLVVKVMFAAHELKPALQASCYRASENPLKYAAASARLETVVRSIFPELLVGAGHWQPPTATFNSNAKSALPTQ